MPRIPAPERLGARLQKKEIGSVLTPTVKQRVSMSAISRRLSVFPYKLWTHNDALEGMSLKRFRSKNFYQGALNEFTRWLVRSEYLAKNSLEHVQKINLNRIKRRKRKALTGIQIEHLLQTLPDLRLKCIVMTAIYTGLRRKEISRLLWSNIQLESDYPALVVDECDTKNGKQAVIPLRPELVEALRAYRRISHSETVFGPFLPFYKLKPYWISAGIPDSPEYDFHALRVTFCTLLEQSGAPPRVAQEAMRQSDSRLTEQTYTDCSKLHVRAAINALPSFRITGANTGSEIATGECF